jgi:ABC-type dipeptide/oligopeptide/nickel transport system permease component
LFKYVCKRLLYAIPVFLGITFAVYALINLAPGGPLAILASSGEMSLSDLEALKVSLGLDKPLIVRYFLWLGGLFQGDLGEIRRKSGVKPRRTGNSPGGLGPYRGSFQHWDHSQSRSSS